MAVRDKAALEAQIAQLLLDNTTGEISPADLRSVLDDIRGFARLRNRPGSGWHVHPDTTGLEQQHRAVGSPRGAAKHLQ